MTDALTIDVLLSSNELEAANRAEATALLFRSGYRVYRPEADVDGEDLILQHKPSGELRRTQLKPRPYVDRSRYENKGLWMLFPDPPYALGRDWFLILHDELLHEWMMPHHETLRQGQRHDYHYPTLTEGIRKFLKPHRIVPCYI